MKKFLKSALAITVTLISFCMLSLAVSAEEHSHEWEMIQNDGVLSLNCYECNTSVLIYENSFLCEHEFGGFASSVSRGEKCLHCGYTVETAHKFETYFEKDVHVGRCIHCNYTEYHPTSVISDESGHSLICQVCNDATLTVEHEIGVNMFENISEDSHGYTCMICDYSNYAPHTKLEIGFVDGFHLIECTGCDLQEYHSITELIDEEGHHTVCDECGKMQTTLEHSEENMTLNTMNEYFHYYECNLCGFIQCESHTSNCICGFACEHLNAIMIEINDYEHSFYCPNCCDEYIEEHLWEKISEDDENSSEFPVYCTRCQHTGTCTVEYGIMMSLNETEDGDYTITLLTNGAKRHYKAWNTYINPGSFVRVDSVYGKCDRISRRVNAEVIDDLDNVIEYLYSNIRSKYPDYRSSLASLTVSNVNYIDDEIYVEFQDKFIESFITSEVVIYNMTSSLMEREIKEGDIILYFTPKEEDSTIILIIG